MSIKSRYWNCSKFADWIRGTPKPYALELEEWDHWKDTTKTQYGIRYWIAEEGLSMLQDIVEFIPKNINEIRYYINNRFYTKTHSLTSTLSKGKFYDLDTRMLHCLFDELVNFVQIEKAWMLVCWSDEKKKQYSIPYKNQKWWLRWCNEWRCEAAGLEYLDWEMSLTNVDFVDPSDPNYGKPTEQALTAAEIKELYVWWTQIRPKRVDPYELSGWLELCENRRKHGKLFQSNKTPEEAELTTNSLKKLREIEDSYDLEDEQMLIRLIKIRKGLWT